MKKVFFSTLFVMILAINLLSLCHAGSSGGYKYYQSLTGDVPDTDKMRWNQIYKKNRKQYLYGKNPALFLKKNLALLPVGKVLDVGMGEGRNAVFLAKKGFAVEGVDISEEAIRKAKQLATENKVRIKTITADLNKYKIPAEGYDVILVFYYLQRSLFPDLVKGLKPGGVLVFEANTVDQLKHDKSINKEYLLNHQELPEIFKELEVIKYEETDDGKNAIASLIARKQK